MHEKDHTMGVPATPLSIGDESTGQLGADIRLLGNLLGEIIREQHGDAAFDLVERVRTQARSRREYATDATPTLALAATIDALTLDEHRVLIKAFSNYFQNMVKFSYALYGNEGTEPNYKYTVKMVRSAITQFEIGINGDKTKVPVGGQKAGVWPGPGAPSFRIGLIAGGTDIGGPEFKGLWSVFRFFADADSQSGFNFVFIPRQGQSNRPIAEQRYEITVDTGGSPVVFSQEFLRTLKCVSAVSR